MQSSVFQLWVRQAYVDQFLNVKLSVIPPGTPLFSIPRPTVWGVSSNTRMRIPPAFAVQVPHPTKLMFATRPQDVATALWTSARRAASVVASSPELPPDSQHTGIHAGVGQARS